MQHSVSLTLTNLGVAISLKNIITTLISTYSQEIKKISKNVKIFSKNTKIENNDLIIKIKKILEDHSNEELQINKKISRIIKQIIFENKILRQIIITKKPNKNDFYKEKQKLIQNDYKLNYNYDDILVKLKKIENNYGKNLDLSYSFNNYNSKDKDKNSSIKKIDKKKSYYDNNSKNDIKLNVKNNNYNNIIFEKKKIRYNKNKKK